MCIPRVFLTFWNHHLLNHLLKIHFLKMNFFTNQQFSDFFELWSTEVHYLDFYQKSTKIHFSDFFEPSSTKIHFLDFYQESTKNSLFSEIGNSLPVGKVSTFKPSILRLYCLKPSPSKKLNHILSHLILSYLMGNLMMGFY